ncbi:hypothetical protein JDV09_13415 [Mycobacterium sp. Y57]|uniref:hypothetical protein n=1 Tax=Mycolicibacterium xanthum TaxID=2796469 RepID=UPI001C840EF1|nr:hypothetical protein [Mycolicibacterium xanthum]MBX7433100.1 hypothetical protein [Mycolicibacterium xanthum]
MSETADRSATERLERRLARERSARLQAEAIAERVASDRWELRQQLEEKLALRTSELEAARRAATAAVAERERCLSAVSHGLRTSLTALFFLAESLSEDEPMSAQQIGELRNLLSDMRSVIDNTACLLNTAGTDYAREDLASNGSGFQMPLAGIVSAYEGGWQQVAARSGKLLILDIETPAGQAYTGTADDANQFVLGLIRDRLDTSAPVVELHLTVRSGALELR